MKRSQARGLIVGLGLGSLALWSGCALDSGGLLGSSPIDPGTGGAMSSTSATPVGVGGMTSASSAGGQGGGSGGAGGSQPTGGSGGGGGDPDAGCVGSEEVCAPWWDLGWARRRRILVDLDNAETLLDYPLLVRLDGNRIDYDEAEDGGADVRFLADGGASPLSQEIEEWNEEGSSYVWVRLPMIQPASVGLTVIWMYYDNDDGGPSGDPAMTWDAGFRSVHHFHANLNDSTAANKDGMAGPPAPSAGPGIIAGARVFDGMDDRVILPGETDFDFSTALSVSAWIKVSSFTKTWQTIVAKGDDSWRLHREENNEFPGFATNHAGPSHDNFGGVTDVNDGGWHQVAVVYDGQEKKVFVDGELDNSKPWNQPINNSGNPVCIGDNNQTGNRQFHGTINEVRISSVVRSDAWMAADYRAVTVNDTLLFGMDQDVPR